MLSQNTWAGVCNPQHHFGPDVKISAAVMPNINLSTTDIQLLKFMFNTVSVFTIFAGYLVMVKVLIFHASFVCNIYFLHE